VPSNVVLKLMKPSVWISILMVTWGIVSVVCCMKKEIVADARVIRS